MRGTKVRYWDIFLGLFLWNLFIAAAFGGFIYLVLQADG